MESLDIQLGRIMWHGTGRYNVAGMPFLIGKSTTGATVKGDMLKPISGERYRLWGEWKPQKPRNGFPAEDAFEFSSHEVVIDQSETGISQYLRNYVDMLGPVKSKAIVDHFGGETLAILRATPERASEVSGITAEVVEAIKQHFEQEMPFDPAAYAALVELFSGYKVPKKIINTLMRDFGSDAPQVVKDRPYMLLAFPRLGWTIVDRFATATAGYPVDGIERHKAAIVEALERLSNQGHTYGTKPDIEAIAFGLINTRPTADSWGAVVESDLISHRQIWDDRTNTGEHVYGLTKLFAAEETIAERLATLAATATPLPFALPDEGLLDGQRDALRLIEQNGVVIVAGAPGTGKTYTVTRTLAGLVAGGFRSIRYMAPTGKAAKRAAELIQKALPDCSIEPSTIHKALGPIPSSEAMGVPKSSAKHGRGRDEFGFRHNADNPIETQIIVIDEASMLDVKLAADLFGAIANGTRVILVGDPHQLPSVGAGSVLRDLIAAGVPTATLTEIQRNSGRIVKACHSIMGGDVPDPAPKVDLDAGDNWIHLEMGLPGQIGAQIVALHESARKNKRFCPLWDMQVISPEKGKPGIGCDDLNRMLGELLNPYRSIDPAKVTEDESGRRPDFERGDKVIRLKNGLADQMVTESDDLDASRFMWDGQRFFLRETDIVNGDMGTVRDICQDARKNWYVIVQFRTPDRLIRLPYGESHLAMANAVTCHKAQGSGFPYVIVPVHESFYYDTRTGQGLWNREMLYTLWSRAEKLLVTVGQMSAIRSAVGRKTVNRRKTRLRGLVSARIAMSAGELVSV